MKESVFQGRLIKDLKSLFPGIEIMKQDAKYHQGIPDLVLFYKDKYAMLECKNSRSAHHQPNQDYYINKFDDWAFARLVYPENKDVVVSDLTNYFQGGKKM